MTRSMLNRRGLGISLLLLSSPLRGFGADTEFQFFQKPEIDFWSKGVSISRVPPPVNSLSKDGKQTTQAQTGAFPWQKYLDPKNDDFFREGDYLPPAPFMEIARNPSDENIENWFRYLELKNQISKRLQSKLEEYASGKVKLTGGPTVDPQSMKQLALRVETPTDVRPEAKRFRLRLYFDSHCPHCERMMETIQALSQQGFWIELRQTDSATAVRGRIPFPVTAATPTELKQYGIESVPVLLVGDLEARSFFKIQGYQTPEAVLSALSRTTAKTHSSKPGGKS